MTVCFKYLIYQISLGLGLWIMYQFWCLGFQLGWVIQLHLVTNLQNKPPSLCQVTTDPIVSSDSPHNLQPAEEPRGVKEQSERLLTQVSCKDRDAIVRQLAQDVRVLRLKERPPQDLHVMYSPCCGVLGIGESQNQDPKVVTHTRSQKCGGVHCQFCGFTLQGVIWKGLVDPSLPHFLST